MDVNLVYISLFKKKVDRYYAEKNLTFVGYEMSEEDKQKQYLVMVDSLGLACMSKLMPGLQFVQVEGMGIPDNNNYQLLVSPLAKKVEELTQETALA